MQVKGVEEWGLEKCEGDQRGWWLAVGQRDGKEEEGVSGQLKSGELILLRIQCSYRRWSTSPYAFSTVRTKATHILRRNHQQNAKIDEMTYISVPLEVPRLDSSGGVTSICLGLEAVETACPLSQLEKRNTMNRSHVLKVYRTVNLDPNYFN